MTQLQLPRFQSHPECTAGVITMDDVRLLISLGWLTPEGAQYLLPKGLWQPSSSADRN
ncbi:MAG: hypothetical protein KME35_03890 [Aphanocapsa sp. GSE-SYN-MK-11-07L]|jgi:hypothetical protein|nr:hypothetical protein [Aphanocapsa sp. GSE-SYN-MK-11-07L]